MENTKKSLIKMYEIISKHSDWRGLYVLHVRSIMQSNLFVRRLFQRNPLFDDI